jgi:DNA replication and repair protein RecF
VGPHRDDFDLLLDGVDMGTFASRGQARTLALTLRLAEATYLASARGDGPVVLLDDILSELDSSRQRRVLETATRYDQTLITTTEAEHVGRHLGTGPAYMQVVEGKVYPVSENLELLASSDVPS